MCHSGIYEINGAAREGLVKRVIFEKRLQNGEGPNHASILGKSISSRENS